MRTRFLLPLVLVAIGGLFGWFAASGRMVDALAQDKKPEPALASDTSIVLPVPPMLVFAPRMTDERFAVAVVPVPLPNETVGVAV